MSNSTEKQEETLLLVEYHLKNAEVEANNALSEVKNLLTDEDFVLLSELVGLVTKNLRYAGNISLAKQESDEERRAVLIALTKQMIDLDAVLGGKS